MTRRRVFVFAAVLLLLGLLAFAGVRMYQRPAGNSAPVASIPVTRVKRGPVELTVVARGNLEGGKPEMLSAPMTGGSDMSIRSLRQSGEVVKAGEVVAELDSTEESFKLREAEADLEEADQQVAQAKAEKEARQEEDAYALVSAKATLEQAGFEARKNPLQGRIQARQNTLAVEAARARLEQLEQDLKNRKDTGMAAIAMQQAARKKAEIRADMARKNIEMMTLRAKSDGYVSVQQNTQVNMAYSGMQLAPYQVGDQVRGGMAVAQIPDMTNWVVKAALGELDQGHLQKGQPAEVAVVAIPGRVFHGKVTDIGGTAGPPWNRRFECSLSLDDPVTELRPGMTANIVIRTESIANAVWIPSQALFESDGRSFVYLSRNAQFVSKDVKLVRRNESQAVVDGLSEGQIVALARPEAGAGQKQAGGALKAIPR
ncbi:MAG: HlyD family efflux transporter periplasmic adaptor subunit [Acidobacteria bacterium]|nr:HlyD family efflux transporter periplasmic adaptor subunit [Acidobacteriota bacterium]